MTGIRKDLLGGLPEQLQGANDQLKQFIGTFQQFLGALGQVTGQMGSTISRVSDQAGVQTPSFLTPQGTNAHADFMDSLSSKLATDAYSRSVARRGAGEMIPALGGRIAFNQPIAEIGGQKIHTTYGDNVNNRAINDLKTQIRGGLEAAGIQEQQKLGQRFGVSFPTDNNAASQFHRTVAGSNASAPTKAMSSYLGYTTADMPRVSGINTGAIEGQLGKTIESLKQSDDVNSKAMLRVFEDIKKELGAQAREYAKARDAFAIAAESKDPTQRAETQNKLLETIAKLDQSIQAATTAQKGGPGGGGAPTGAPPMAMFGRAAGIAGAVAGVGLAGYQLYAQSAMSQDRVIMDAQLSKQAQQGRLHQSEFSELMASQDMTKADNILRFRGNSFLPGSRKGQFFGDHDALRRSYSAGGERTQIGIDIEKQERTSGLVGGIGSMLLGGLAIGAGFMVGGPLGAGLAMGGVGGMIGGLSNKAQNGVGQASGVAGGYLGSSYTTLSGDINSGASGMFGSFRRGDQFGNLADDAIQGARFGKVADSREYAMQLQSAEMSKYSAEKIAIEQRLSFTSARKEGAVLVGEYAGTGDELLAGGMASRIQKSINREISLGFTESNTPEARRLQKEINKVNFGSSIQKDLDRFGTASPSRRQRAFADIDDAAAGTGFDFSFGMLGRAQDYLTHGFDDGAANETDSVRKAKKDAYRTFRGAKTKGTLDNFAAIRGSEIVGGISSPLGGGMRVTSGFGERTHPVLGMSHMHAGLDLVSNSGNSNLYAVADSSVVDKGFNSRAGNYVSIQGKDGRVYRYNHLASPSKAALGSQVTQNQVIGTMGATGTATGPHLDFRAYQSMGDYRAARPFDPSAMLGLASDAPAAPKAGTPMGLAASLEMSMAELYSSRNQLTNYLGGSRTASYGQTAEMVKLGRSGLGSFDQLLGNLGMINQTAGGQDNTKVLEATLTQAVAAGFDKSRTSQRFVQTTGQIAESLRLTNMANTAAVLGTTSTLASAGTAADERGMSLAAAGMTAYGQFTGNTGGLSGALTAIGLNKAGFNSRNGGGIVSKLSAPQMTDFIKTLEGGGTITDVNLESLLGVSGLSKTELASKLRDVRRTTVAPITTTLDQKMMGETFGGIKFKGMDDFLGQLKGMDRKKQQSTLRELKQQVVAYGSTTSLGYEGALAYLGDSLEVNNLGQYKDLVSAKKQSGNAIYTDPANQNRLNFMEELTKDFTANSKGALDPGSAKKLYFKSIGESVAATRMIDVNGTSRPLTEEAYKNGDAAFKAAADKEFESMDRFDIARGMQDKVLQESNAQPVKIMNLVDMVEMMFRVNGTNQYGEKTGRKE